MGYGVGVGIGDGLGDGDCVGVGEGEGTGVGSGVGVGVVVGLNSAISPSVALLVLLNKESEGCVIAGLITLTKHTVITTKVPIPFQLHFSFIRSIVLSL